MQPRSVEVILPQKTLPLPGRDVARPDSGAQRTNILQLRDIQADRNTFNQTSRAELRLIVEFNPTTLLNVQAAAPQPAAKSSAPLGRISTGMLGNLLALQEDDSEVPATPPMKTNLIAAHYGAAASRSPYAADSLFSLSA